MSINLQTAADHLDAASTPLVGAPLALSIWFKTTRAQGRRFFSINHSGQNTDFFSVALDVQPAASGKLVGLVSIVGNSQQAVSAVITDNLWQHGLFAVVSTFTRNIWLDGANKATATGVFAPAGLNGITISGRLTDHNNAVGGAVAHACLWSKGTWADVEAQYLGGGGHPLNIAGLVCYWKLAARAATAAPDVGSTTLTVTGGTTGADDPNVESVYTGAAIGAQVYTQNAAITPLAVAAGFDAVNATGTLLLMRVGSTTASTTASAAGAVTRVLPVVSSAAFATGDYVSVAGGALTRVLAVLSPNILVAQDQTFASGATVARFPVAPIAVPGCSLTTTWSGTPTTVQATTANCFFRWINTNKQTLFTDSGLFSITVNAQPVAPSFSVAPAITAVAVDGYTVGFTPNTGCTAYLGAYPEHATAPTISQLKAGTGALAIATKAITGVDSLTVGGLDFPTHDLYLVLNNPLGDSTLVSLLNQLKAPPSGCTYRVFTSVSAGTCYFGNASVADIEESRSTLTPSGAIVALSPDGQDSYTATGRQLRTARLYNKAGRAWYLDDSGSQTYQVWYNNAPPIFVGSADPYIITVGIAVSQDLRSLWQDANSDPMTITALDALPANLTIVNGQLGGVALGNSVGTYKVRGRDLPGDSVDGSIGIVAGKVPVPNVFSLDYHDAIAVDSASFLTTVISFVDDTGPPNIVLGQDPLTGFLVDPRSIVTLTVSRTPAGTAPAYGLRRHSFQCVPYINGDLDMRHPLGT